MREGAMPNDAHVARRQAHRPADVVGVAIVHEGREDDGARTRFEPLQALV